MKKPSASLVISLIALFISLGGTSYAVTTLDDNSVTTSKIRDGAVTGPKLATASVDGTKVKLDSINGTHLKAGAVKTTNVFDGSIDSAKIKDGSIAAGDLAAGAASPPVLHRSLRISGARSLIGTAYAERDAVRLPVGRWLVTADLHVVGPPSRDQMWLISNNSLTCALANVDPAQEGERLGSKVFDTLGGSPNGLTRWTLRAAIEVTATTSPNARVGVWCGNFTPPSGQSDGAAIFGINWHALKVSSIGTLGQ